MQGIQTIRKANPSIADAIENQQGGFITADQVAALKTNENAANVQVLVRCGNGRFITTIRDCEHFVNIIGEHADLKADQTGNRFAGDHVRDVALMALGKVQQL